MLTLMQMPMIILMRTLTNGSDSSDGNDGDDDDIYDGGTNEGRNAR